MVSAPPVEPAQPLTAVMFGKATWAMPYWLSLAVAFSLNEPLPAGRKYWVWLELS